MKTIGIVCEYNPFHNGHKLHIDKSRLSLNASNIICVMSGNFVQRGEPAIIDKWSRAISAIHAGADLVLELPTVYAIQSAEYFALGAISLLDRLNCVDYISFGSETGNIDLLNETATLLLNESNDFSQKIKENMDNGFSYPKAMSMVIGEHMDMTPNNILGLEYIKALKKLNSSMLPYTIKREGASYNDTDLKSELSSASAIRKHIEVNKSSLALINSLTDISYNMLNDNEHINLNDFSDIILYAIRIKTTEELSHYITGNEGLEHRIKKSAQEVGNVCELINKVKTKRYSEAFIKRSLLHILLNIDRDFVARFKTLELPMYARVLAFNSKGKDILRDITLKSDLQIINKVSDFKAIDDFTQKIFDIDLKSTDIYNLGHKNSPDKIAMSDYLTSPIYIKIN